MLWVGFCLMAIGLSAGLTAIHKAVRCSVSPVVACWLCYGGLFVALVGAVLVGKVL